MRFQVKCSSLRVNVMVGLTICNLLVCPVCQKAAIHAGGLSVLKIIASMDIDELTEATARVIVNLVLEPSLHANLLRETLVPVLVLFLQHPSRIAFECSLHALSCMAQHEPFHNMMIDRGCVTALVGALMSGRIVTRNTAVEVCRTLCLVFFNQKRTVALIMLVKILIAPHIVYRNGTCTPQAATMMAMLFRNLSYDRAMFKVIMEQDVLRLLKCLYTDFRMECAGILRASIIFMNNIAHDHTMHQALLKQGLMTVMHAIVQTSAEYSSTRKHVLHKPHTFSVNAQHGHGHHPSLSGHGSNHNSSHSIGHNSGHNSKEPSPRQPGPHLFQKSLSMKSAVMHNAGGNVHNPHLVLDDTLPDERFDPPHTKYLILTKKDIYFIARTLNLVSTSPSCHEAIVEGNAVQICDHLLADDAMKSLARCVR
jgi:hypothetical protein